MRKLLYIIIFFAAAGSLYAQIKVSADTDSSKYFVGDYINYMIEVTTDPGVNVFVPVFEDSLENIDFIQKYPPTERSAGSKNIAVYHYVFSVYDSSEVTFPPINIGYTVQGDTVKQYLDTNPVTVIVSTLPVDPQAEIRDVKAPIKIPLDWWIILIIALAVLSLAAGGYFGYRYYKKKKSGAPAIVKKIVIPPHKAALKSLNELESKKLWQQGKVKDYHSEITGIIRRYFEDRFSFLAMEMPSSEVLANLEKIKETGEVFDITREFLSNADMVKFAKFQPMPSINDEMMKQAHEIVNVTKPSEDLTREVEEVQDV
ncbi:MAG: hypothetical protein K9J16_15125 [Melioribacteraceae bacterium]|nr:hypothetical protein [Melioribacteraceae bacterium]MCF8355123.1 hypothetical protein [Melioribacteraceae bacterium]MCF8392400.1 hypothetical protein [Melioribacteraceae bacterium]MCF8417921.1 hypothetical protein [Melioribacteraceae bacterium]